MNFAQQQLAHDRSLPGLLGQLGKARKSVKKTGLNILHYRAGG